jgi:hypothetical protein
VEENKNKKYDNEATWKYVFYVINKKSIEQYFPHPSQHPASRHVAMTSTLLLG